MPAARVRSIREGHQALPEGDERHGTISGRTNYGCTCPLCLEVARQYRSRREMALLKLAKAGELEWSDRRIRHGRFRTYGAGCRCDRCKRANARYKAKYEAKRAAEAAVAARNAGEAPKRVLQRPSRGKK